MSESCLFCRIVAGEIPAQLVAQNAHCVAFRDLAPQAPLHVLVVPRTHVGSLGEATDATMLGEVALMAAQVARDAGYGESGFRAVVNDGRDAGQTVRHLHMHVLAGRALGMTLFHSRSSHAVSIHLACPPSPTASRPTSTPPARPGTSP